MKIKISLLKLIIAFFLCAVISFYGGYILRGVHYRLDYSRVEIAQAELRLDLERIKQERELMKIVNKFLLEYNEIIEWNSEAK